MFLKEQVFMHCEELLPLLPPGQAIHLPFKGFLAMQTYKWQQDMSRMFRNKLIE